MTASELIKTLKVEGTSNVYYIGTGDRGITIFKQQVRAINLMYSLQKESIVKKDSKVCIIGGGIAGITASAAALSIGCKVFLFEKKSILLHLQTGCKTRWVHPHIYDWPLQGSQFPYASLPLLSWQEGYASDVTQQILDEYSKTIGDFKNHYYEFLGSTFKINKENNSIDQESSLNHDYVRFSTHYDALILATGFGLELGVNKNDNYINKGEQNINSYWRNDDLDQPFIGSNRANKRAIVISGTGDGSCIDLMRSTLKNFHQGRLIDDLFLDRSNEITTQKLPSTVIKETLSKIKREYFNYRPKDSCWLYYQFTDIPSDQIEPAKSFLKSQIRKDTEVFLIGRQKSMHHMLHLEKMSVFNAFTIYLLYSLGKIKYHGVKDFQIINNNKKFRPKIKLNLIEPLDGSNIKYLEYDTYIPRHGPNKAIEASMKSLGIDSFKLTNVDETSVRIWQPGWPPIDDQNKYEFVPPTARTIISTFVEIMASNLMRIHETGSSSFRLTYLRFIKINDSTFFQQLSRYAGTATTRSIRTLGRIFPSNFGIVGYSANIGQPVLLRREEDFLEACRLMGKVNIKDEVQSMLCIPILSPSQENKVFVNSVLYLDSSEKNFFSDEVIEIIINSCEGFINSLERMKESGQIKISENLFKGIEFGSHVNEEYFKSITIGNEISEIFSRKTLEFDTISSLDMYA